MPIIQESPSAKEARKRKKGLLTVGLTKQNLRSSLRKESLRRKVSYGYEDNRRRRDWLVVRIRSLSEYKNGYFLLQRTNQRHSELVCYWPACKQRVESIKANVREKNIMSQCLVRCKVQDLSQLSMYIICSKYNPWKTLIAFSITGFLRFFLITRPHCREESLYRLPGKTILQFPPTDPDEIAAKSREGYRRDSYGFWIEKGSQRILVQ